MSSSVNRPSGDGPLDPRRPEDPECAGTRHGTDGDGARDGATHDDMARERGSRRDAGAGRDPGAADGGRPADRVREDTDAETPAGQGGPRNTTARDGGAAETTRRRPATRERVVKERSRATRAIARTVAAIVALVFLVVGVLGFIPGITTGVDRMTLYGAGSAALLLGIFQVSVLHNVVHLAFGVVGLLMSRSAGAARTFLIGGGIIYLVLWILGLMFGSDANLNVVPVNDADNWLHLGLGVVMVLLGLLVGRRHTVSREIVD